MTTETTIRQPKVGDYFVATWGYDQTNKTWLKVVKVSASGKSVYTRRVWGKRIGSQGINDIVVPDPDNYYSDDPKPRRHLVQRGYKNKPYIRWADFRGGLAYLWDGSAQQETNALYGH